MSRMLVRKLIITACICVLQYPAAISTRAQRSNDLDFGPIPIDRQARLVERLKLLIDYQIKQDWAKQYDLFSALIRRAEGKLDFIRLAKKEMVRGWKLPLAQFVPMRVRDFHPDAQTKLWVVLGCAKLREKDRFKYQNGMVEAYWERNDWYFSEVQMLADIDERRCGQEQR